MKPDLKSALFALSQHESTILALCLGTKILNGGPCSGFFEDARLNVPYFERLGPKRLFAEQAVHVLLQN